MTAELKFNIIGYIKKLRNAGVSQEIAEIQAEELENVLKIAINTSKEEFKSKELATKGDIRESELKLQKEIANFKTQTLVWIGLNSAFLLGVMAKGFNLW
ncbi:MAG: hypothetical protein KBD37_06590 [Burkholderiales bacterium]|nr:hypothetical protein [Burkholderiales bacterium]